MKNKKPTISAIYTSGWAVITSGVRDSSASEMTVDAAYPINASDPREKVEPTDEPKIEPHQPRLITLKPPPGWKASLLAGWSEEPRVPFYIREFLLGVIICMAQIPESSKPSPYLCRAALLLP